MKKMRLELTRPNGHYPLKVARLPIPPFLQLWVFESYLFVVPRTRLELARLSTLAPETSASTIPPPGLAYPRAENEARTRDPNLGKVMLYQLSYFRIFFVNEVCFSIAGAKVEFFFESPKLFRYFFILIPIHRICWW